ncbi:MAG: hypothetical protein ACON5K_02750 [Bacteroidia bacterium]
MSYQAYEQNYNNFYNYLLIKFEVEADLALDINAVVEKHLGKLSKRYNEIFKILKAEGLVQFFKEIDYQMKLNKNLVFKKAFEEEVRKQKQPLDLDKVKLLSEWRAYDEVMREIESYRIENANFQEGSQIKSGLHWQGEKIELIKLALAMYKSHYVAGSSRQEFIKGVFQIFNLELSKSYVSDLSGHINSNNAEDTDLFYTLRDAWLDHVSEKRDKE